MKSALTTAILVVALTADFVIPYPDLDLTLAQQLLAVPSGTAIHPLDLDGEPAFFEDQRAVLFFSRQGKQGWIRGAVVVLDDAIHDVILIESRDGLRHTELWDHEFLSSFARNRAKPPVDVNVVSGATVSCQIVIDAVNERLKQWNARRQDVVSTTLTP